MVGFGLSIAAHLRLSYSQTNNFAYGGATTESDRNTLVPGLLTQVQSFTQTHQQTNQMHCMYCGRERMTAGGKQLPVPVENVTRAISLANVGVKISWWQQFARSGTVTSYANQR